LRLYNEGLAHRQPITINAASSHSPAAVAYVFRGLADDKPLDRTHHRNGLPAPHPLRGRPSTTSEANELLIGANRTEGPDTMLPESGRTHLFLGLRFTGTTVLDRCGTNLTISLGYRIVSATGAVPGRKERHHLPLFEGRVIATPSGIAYPNAPRIHDCRHALRAFLSVPGNPSTDYKATCTPSNLTFNITINAPSDFQVSLTNRQ
jgi:hypothetical protein